MDHQQACDFVMPFGKHNGETLWSIVCSDPKYIDWMAGQNWSNAPNVLKALTKFLGHTDVQRKIDTAVYD